MTTDPDQPTMRVTNIALDYDELPREITVIMSQSIADRINQDQAGFPAVAGEPVTVPIQLAGRVAKHFGGLPPSEDGVTGEIWGCLTGVVFNRFWEGGLDEYLAGAR